MGRELELASQTALADRDDTSEHSIMARIQLCLKAAFISKGAKHASNAFVRILSGSRQSDRTLRFQVESRDLCYDSVKSC